MQGNFQEEIRNISIIFSEVLNKCSGNPWKNQKFSDELRERLFQVQKNSTCSSDLVELIKEAKILHTGFEEYTSIFFPMSCSPKMSILQRLNRIEMCLRDWEEKDRNKLLDIIEEIEDSEESRFADGFSCWLPRRYKPFFARWESCADYLPFSLK